MLKSVLRNGRVGNTILNRNNFRCYHADLDKPPYVLPSHTVIDGAPMVYISGEEMTHYTMHLILEKWIKPHVDMSQWQYFDLTA